MQSAKVTESSTSGRVFVKTEKGVLDKQEISKLKQIHNTELEKAPVINSIVVNQSQEYFAVATDTGFEIIQNDSSSDKLKKKTQDLGESVDLVEMMYKTNIIVLVFSNQKNKVVIWDDHEKKNRTEITFSSNNQIRNIRLRKDLLVVVLEEKTFVFNFVTLKLIEQIETCSNPTGLCGLSTLEKPTLKTVCVPAKNKGWIKSLNYMGNADKSIANDIQAHENSISALVVSAQGTLIASASQKGTLIKIFSADGGEFLQQVRRGTGSTEITDLAFHPTLNLIACTSAKPSIHIFEFSKSIEKCIEAQQYGFS